MIKGGDQKRDNTNIMNLVKSLAEFIQEMQLSAQSGQKGPVSPRRSTQEFVRRCRENKISACIFIKKTSPTMKRRVWSYRKLLSVKYAILRNWPQEEATLHVHITCVLNEMPIRHIEVLPPGHISVEPGDIEIEIEDFPSACMPAQNKESLRPPAETPNEGNVLSETETRRFLESMGLGDILQPE